MDAVYYTFQIKRSAVNMDRFLERYHFDEADRELLWGLWCVLTELVEVRAGVLLRADGKQAVCLVTLGERYDRLSELMEESGHLLMSLGLECFGLEMLSAAYDRLEARMQMDVGAVPSGREFPDAEELFAADADPGNETGDTRNLPEAFGSLGVIWDNGMLHPQKSVLYTVSIEAVSGSDPAAARQDGDDGHEREDSTEGKAKAVKPVGNGTAGHDCEKCGQVDCPFRSRSGQGDGQDDCTIRDRDGETGEQEQSVPCGSATVYSYGISRIFGNGRMHGPVKAVPADDPAKPS